VAHLSWWSESIKSDSDPVTGFNLNPGAAKAARLPVHQHPAIHTPAAARRNLQGFNGSQRRFDNACPWAAATRSRVKDSSRDLLCAEQPINLSDDMVERCRRSAHTLNVNSSYNVKWGSNSVALTFWDRERLLDNAGPVPSGTEVATAHFRVH